MTPAKGASVGLLLGPMLFIATGPILGGIIWICRHIF